MRPACLSQVAVAPRRGSVLAHQGFVVNAQKRLDNRRYAEEGHPRSSGVFLDPRMEHCETCSTAEATRGHDACVNALLKSPKLTDLALTNGTARTHRIDIQVG